MRNRVFLETDARPAIEAKQDDECYQGFWKTLLWSILYLIIIAAIVLGTPSAIRWCVMNLKIVRAMVIIFVGAALTAEVVKLFAEEERKRLLEPLLDKLFGKDRWIYAIPLSLIGVLIGLFTILFLVIRSLPWLFDHIMTLIY